jgi:hypothetical protein
MNTLAALADELEERYGSLGVVVCKMDEVPDGESLSVQLCGRKLTIAEEDGNLVVSVLEQHDDGNSYARDVKQFELAEPNSIDKLLEYIDGVCGC